MDGNNPNIGGATARIRQLDDAAINRIAAGEVIERPASAVKELLENALDAGALRIDVDIADGGKSLIRVADDGSGIEAVDLPLALSRHATSKIDGSDLLDIRSFGFRGEALASLAGVARLSIVTRTEGEAGAEIRAEGGVVRPVRPAGASAGTTVEVRDLFFATPARLKFLRTDRAETQAITDTVKRLAMACPEVAIRLRDVTADPRILLDLPACHGANALQERLGAILGAGFRDNAIVLDATREGLHLGGFAALPTYSRGAAVQQHVLVNGRPVRDRMLLGALRAAYSDLLSRDRHPAAVIAITCDPNLVDVNVHPAKSEVRFRDPAVARGLVVSGIRHALAEAGHRASTTVAGAVLGAMSAPVAEPRVYQMDRPSLGPGFQSGFAETAAPSARFEAPEPDLPASDGPLGAARAQVHENYIIAQTRDGIVLVDQHAAHERLVYERLKAERTARGVARQMLLVPDIVELGDVEADRLLSHSEALAEAGLVIEAFGPGAVAVQETPAILGPVDGAALVADVLDQLADIGASTSVSAKIDAILSRIACHGSVRSGRQMRAEEMNALLREMEATPNSGQCNHGRPTYVELKLSDIERLFGRT